MTTTFEDVAAAAQKLQGAQQPVSIRSVRRVLGSGSPNVIHRHLREWRTAQLVPGTSQTPVRMVAHMTEAAPRFWAAALEEARLHVRAEVEHLQQELDQARIHVDEVQGLLDESEERRTQANAEQQRALAALDAVTAQFAQLKAQLDSQAQHIDEAQASLKAQQDLNAHLAKRGEEMEERAEQLRHRHHQELSTRDDALQAIGHQADQLQAQLDSAADAADRLTSELDATRTQLLDRDRRLAAHEEHTNAERSNWRTQELRLHADIEAARAATLRGDDRYLVLQRFCEARSAQDRLIEDVREGLLIRFPGILEVATSRLAALEEVVRRAIPDSPPKPPESQS